MLVTSVISTKGGVGKTTIAANLGGFIADAGLRVLLIDLDIQPTLSSYFKLKDISPFGTYELIAFNEYDIQKVISHTSVNHLDLVYSNDDRGQLNTLLLHAPDGRFRLRNIQRIFGDHYDLMLIDTQGARSVLLEMAVIASKMVISPVTPEVLAAREFRRGTLQLMEDIAPYAHLGITPAPLHMLVNRVPTVSTSARIVHKSLKEVFCDQQEIQIIETVIPQIEAYTRAAALAQPVHRIERIKPYGRVTPSALDTMRKLAIELFPQWREKFDLVTGKAGH
ncbi:Sporulation initiation inhibitor protein Soj [Saezia sanguinis]|uniref:Sporulation initiation inhibitor protein Soj n=1 Tax=Saezia sanguinis TaxID=1965230 RepID=A0A433SGK3_9BURK|nr:ParA family protein [Saezia sanguinis]RUS67784.1 Sporulation initiation inhibitor protein Soj [Saezia sanguinis]